ncbi:hypothetical protein KQX54_007486 [Cotesia glomerata]|uniref:Secreted protein n=1 Tax=Cotesia glomerata TaxID=32391 RepID=A0AAV7J571_COTGL|nr:hypothetical protein KQX54_007486 [Cotesia glomerata]
MRVRRGSSLLAFSFVHVMVTSLYLASIYTLYYCTYTNSEPILTIEPGINRVTWLVTAGRGLSPTKSHEKTGTSPRRLELGFCRKSTPILIARRQKSQHLDLDSAPQKGQHMAKINQPDARVTI